MLKEPRRLPVFVTPEHFGLIYNKCDTANYPGILAYPVEDWWQGLLTFAYMTGWRIGEILELRRDDINLELGTAITRADSNKGKRDDIVPLHPIVVDHLGRMPGFETVMFPWDRSRELIWTEFRRIQKAAGIELPCRKDHEHTDACHTYGFHDLRRAFASSNATNMPAEALQRLMRHESYTTTQKYINLATQLRGTADKLFVPDVLRKKAN